MFAGNAHCCTPPWEQKTNNFVWEAGYQNKLYWNVTSIYFLPAGPERQNVRISIGNKKAAPSFG